MRTLLLAALATCGVNSECSVESLMESRVRDPDPRRTELSETAATRLLDETRQHTAAGRYPEALTSMTAYHYGARSAVGHGGVRLSYAIDDWYKLGGKYPLAMSALLRARDEAAEAVLDNTYCGDDFEAFSEVSAINKRIGERAKTAELFLQIAEGDVEQARRLYLVAESELVAAGFYRQANRFLDPEGKLRQAIQAAEGLREFRKGQEPDVEIERFERDYTTRELATLVALLVANRRDDEAGAFAVKAKAAFPGQDFAAALDRALLGRFPGPDP